MIRPQDAHAAHGVGGHVAFVVPSCDRVVARRADAAGPAREVDGATLGAMPRVIVPPTE